MKDTLQKLNHILGIEIKNHQIFLDALTHRSYLNEHKNENPNSNERLEFLGDAVLELLTSEFLFEKFPDKQEGELTSFRASLVRTEILAEVTKELELHKFLRMGRSEDVEKVSVAILADMFEALIGAIFVDLGIDKVKAFLSKNLFLRIDDIVAKNLFTDPKTYYQSYIQEKEKFTPTYSIISEKGKDHDKEFTAGVYVNGELRGVGLGRSKQSAETEAARVAVDGLII
ncbi:ribonuclease III [bacterium]|nr:MAG: ribonuclease III [bacterium]